MIQAENNVFFLHTEHTTYAFRVMETGQLEHLYYGRRLKVTEENMRSLSEGMTEKHSFAPGNSVCYNQEHCEFTLEDVCLEMSSYGKGDIREPFIEVVHSDGSFTSDFLFSHFETDRGKGDFETLPGSYGENVEWLKVILKDKQYELTLELNYYVYDACDVITRSVRLLNDSKEEVSVKRLMSAQVDFDRSDYVFTTFNGAWAREMERKDHVINGGKISNASYTGTSSNRANPFVMLSRMETTEDFGECYGFNLIYSGNHYEAVEENSFGKLRFVTGINPQSFSYQLGTGEFFEAPEAVMTYSVNGFNGMSQNMHHFVKQHIVRGEWKEKVRPVLLNSWEAAYFDIDEKKLLKLAKAGKDVGIELFVMDDGWFGKRDSDNSSLGDWDVNLKKLPQGVEGLCKKVNELGLSFGIWVEPEMINTDSELYRAHPEWAMDIPGKPHSEGRNQRILDLTREDVQRYIIDSMTKLFSSANIAYVKWDMNRIVSDCYSKKLPYDRQGEVMHRYVLGLYRCMKVLTEKFPHILFEGCAAGGNRFDLGILSYFPQIWASDDTDCVCRSQIQTGYSYGYPMSTVSAHVSACPNHQTLRVAPIESRFNVAAFGVFGYECNFCDMKKEELDSIKKQIALYKEWREVLQFGDFYRGRSVFAGSAGMGAITKTSSGNITEWTCVSGDKEKAVGMVMKKLAEPNTQYETYRAKGLLEDTIYHFYKEEQKHNIKEFGDLVNNVSPVHIKQDSILHNVVAKVVKMDGETEDYYMYGDALMYAGVKLKQAFGGTGYNGDVRHFPDFASRMYFMEKCEE